MFDRGPFGDQTSKKFGVSNGNCAIRSFHPTFVDEVDYTLVHQTARALMSALLEGANGMEEARDFLKSLGDDPRALRPLIMILEGDVMGVRRATELLTDLLPSCQPPDREVDR